MAQSKWKEFLDFDKWDWILLASFFLAVILYSLFLSHMQQMPGPMYGGDKYYHYGHVNHIADGGNPFKSSQFVGEYEHYPWLTHGFIAFISWVSPWTTLKASSVVFPIIATLLSGLIFYILGWKLFDSKPFGVLLGVLWMTHRMYVINPSNIASGLTVPLVFLLLYFAKTRRQRLWAGVAAGLSALQHLIAFLGSMLGIIVLALFKWGQEHLRIEDSKFKIANVSEIWTNLKEKITQYAPALGVGAAVGMVYLWIPFFVYKMQTLNPWQEYTGSGSSSAGIGTLLADLGKKFLPTHTWFQLIISILVIAGMILSFKDRKGQLPWIILLTSVIGYLHPLITEPILGTSFGYYRFPIMFTIASYIFAGLGVYWLVEYFKDKVSIPHFSTLVIFGLIALSLLNYGLVLEDQKENNKWIKVGFSMPENTRAMLDMAEQIRDTTSVNTVFLSSHGETSFALNGITGRKVVHMRRTHANNYVDVDKRIADAAIMLYGNKTKAHELLREYNVDYLYEDSYSFRSRARCLQAWEKIEQSPPTTYNCLRTDPKYADYLRENGVEFKTVHARKDVASNKAPTFDLLAIKPTQNFENFNVTPAFSARTRQGVVGLAQKVILE